MKALRIFEWPAERIVAIRDAYENGRKSIEALVVEFKCSGQTLRGLAKKHGWVRKLLPNGGKRLTLTDPARVAAIRLAYEGSDLQVQEIAARFSIGTSSIARLVVELGWRPRVRGGNFSRNNSAHHKPVPISDDARTRNDTADVLAAKKLLQRAGWVCWGKGPLYMVGTRYLDRDGLLAKAARVGA